MKTVHTPGPWVVTRHASPDHSPQFGVYAEGDAKDLAIVRYDNAKADAYLIAAAPELLAALQDSQDLLAEILRTIADNATADNIGEQSFRNDAAIAKATEESP